MRYERPETSAQAASLLAQAQERAFVLAGGTDLLVKMRHDDFEADLVVDIKSIEGMRDIQKGEDGLLIGAGVPCAALSENEGLSRAWPGLVEAANLIGSSQIQGRCTVSGNLCNASPAADSVPAMVAAGAKAKIIGPDGSRLLAVEYVPEGPGIVSLAIGEFIEAILLPNPQPRTGDAYVRFTPRTEMDIAVVGAAVCLTLNSTGEVSAARIALGAVGPKVILAENAAQTIIGTKLDDGALEDLAEACSAAATPIDDKRGTVAFRKHVAGVLAKRAAKIAYNRAGEQ
jgi:carbon-monoxide dehydrogenase medium subunit